MTHLQLFDLQMRLRIFQSYINDLTDQNAVLVKTVEDIENDANARVKRLEAKLQKATASAKVCNFLFVLCLCCLLTPKAIMQANKWLQVTWLNVCCT
jgi:vacuolar-type H+-ATPase subunit D/Vma8